MLAGGLAAASAQAPHARTSFTQADLASIKAQLRGLDPKSYRIVLPVVAGGRVVGTETFGALPFNEVRRMANEQNLGSVTPTGNVQAISDLARTDGGGPGSHTESSSGGTRLMEQIDSILEQVDGSQYFLLR
jgi:hypothetical protein